MLSMPTFIKQDSPDSRDLLVSQAMRVRTESKETRVTQVSKESMDRRAKLEFLDWLYVN